jgi:tyrosine-specific transport protein
LSKIKKFIYSVATISGTTIGVGIFSLPYLASKVGFPMMLAYFAVLGVLVGIIHMIFGRLAVATPDFKRLPGFAKFHLGRWGEKISLFSSLLGTYGAILAYIIVGGDFLKSLLYPFIRVESGDFYTLLYFAAGALMIFLGIKIIAQVETWSLVFFFAVMGIIFLQVHPAIKMDYLAAPTEPLSLYNFFLPYGAILFSLWGAALIPEVEEMLGKDKALLKKVIPVATLIPILIYAFFVYLILGITGPTTTESALTGLKSFLGDEMFILVLLLGILTTFTSFITLGLTLKRVFWYDLNISKNKAWALTCLPPLAIFLLGLKSFITVISLGGGIMLGVDGTLILLMYRRMSKKEGSKAAQFLALALISVFVLGLTLQIISFLN